MTRDYAVRLRCPCGDEDRWVRLRKREENLEQVLRTPWDFECPLHGVQQELPLEAREIGPLSSAKPQLPAVAGLKTGQRRSKRLPLHLPVLVYGRTRGRDFFKEETATVLVNAHGGLIALNGRVRPGETISVVNTRTQEEQECLVTYVGMRGLRKTDVGIAFKYSAPNFWQVNFPAR